jgi:hypothetical protein
MSGISEQDAQRIADAVAGQTPEGRRSRFSRTMNDLIHGQGSTRREAQEAKLSRVFDKGKPTPQADTASVDAALARVRADREAAEADRDAAIAERDAARAEREAAERGEA